MAGDRPRKGRAGHRRGLGIGRASAERFAAEGAEVVVVDVDAESAREAAAAIEAAGGSARSLPHRRRRRGRGRGDGGGARSSASAASTCSISNAGILDDYQPAAEPATRPGTASSASTSTAMFFTARALLPQMLERGGGAIVNVASTAGLNGGNGGAAYTTSKHAVIGFTRQLCFDYARRGSAAT